MNPRGTQLLAEFIYCSEDLLKNSASIESILRYGIDKAGFHLISLTSHQFSPGGATVVAIIGESHVAIHTYPEARHATIDIFTCSSHHDQHKLLRILQEKLAPETVRVVEVRRGNPMEIKDTNWMTEFSTKGFDVRYHVREEILNKQTEYQKITIIENENFGRMLFLDHDLQVSEKDAAIYNAALVNPFLQEKPRLGDVLILGGGDGGVLHEVLKHDPDHVVLVDIDEQVIRASERYLPGICNHGFHHPRVEVVIGDANEYLKAGRGVDAVIYDLTMHPESFTDKDRATYLDEMFSSIRRNLHNHGMVSMQCCSEFDTDTLDLLQDLLPRYFKKITFNKTFIPCFCENWMFAAADAG